LELDEAVLALAIGIQHIALNSLLRSQY